MDHQTVREFVQQLNDYPNGIKGVFDRGGYLPMLPFLEYSHEKLQAELGPAAQEVGIPDIYMWFCFRDLVEFGLRAHGWFWPALAIGWIERGFPIDDGIADAGYALIDAKRCTQRLRHTLFTLLRRWSRCHDG